MADSNMNKNYIIFCLIVSVILHLGVIIYFNYVSNFNKKNVLINADLTKLSVSFSKKTVEKKKNFKKLGAKLGQGKIKKEKVGEVKKIEEKKLDNEIPIIDNANIEGVRTPPQYPRRALMLKQEGVVILKALVNEKGEVVRVELIFSSGYSVLDRSAKKTVLKWKFNSNAIKTKNFWVKIPIEFKIG
jgi:TonB family protein